MAFTWSLSDDIGMEAVAVRNARYAFPSPHFSLPISRGIYETAYRKIATVGKILEVATRVHGLEISGRSKDWKHRVLKRTGGWHAAEKRASRRSKGRMFQGSW